MITVLVLAFWVLIGVGITLGTYHGLRAIADSIYKGVQAVTRAFKRTIVISRGRYCYGAQETARRRQQLAHGTIHTN